MTTAVEIRYPWGRVHATPWGRHTNEGAVEWPPAPRRILRALYAAWKTRHPEFDEKSVHALIRKLAVLPVYGTDEVRSGSSRHWLAADGHTAGNYDRDLALDAFLSCRTDRGVIVEWAVDLASAERQMLAELLEGTPFLGRAESLCEMRLTDGSPDDREFVWSPVDVDSSDAHREVVDLLAVEQPVDIDALIETPSSVRRRKRLQPSGARAVAYAAADGSSEHEESRVLRTYRAPTAVRFHLDGVVPWPESKAIIVAHVLRQAALSRGPDRSATLSGRSTDRGIRRDQHGHAHYLLFAAGGSGIDTAVVWAPEGLDDDHVRGLARITHLRAQHIKGFPVMRAVLEGVGQIEAVLPELSRASRQWRTRTPFVINRYPKDARPFESHVVEQVHQDLQRRGFPTARVEVDHGRSWREFRRHRPDGTSMRSARPARHVMLEFDQPVAGPICLGALSHFSIGLFEPM